MTPSGISRREILAGLSGVGVVGAVSGAGTYALLTDEESFGGSIQSGTLTVDVSCQRCIVDEDGVSFSFGGIDRGDSGRETITLTVETNPARLWLQSDCPPAVDRLGDELVITLRYNGITVESGTLSTVRRSLRGGISLGGECTTPGEATELDLEWSLPDDTPDSVAGEQTSLQLELLAEQCRHVDTISGGNPFAGAPACDDPEECRPCDEESGDRIANATFEYDGPNEAFLELVQGNTGNSPPSNDLFAGALNPGDTFVSALPPSGNADVSVFVGGEEVGEFHTSCSQPFGPGVLITNGTYSVTVLEATDKAGNTICEVNYT